MTWPGLDLLLPSCLNALNPFWGNHLPLASKFKVPPLLNKDPQYPNLQYNTSRDLPGITLYFHTKVSFIFLGLLWWVLNNSWSSVLSPHLSIHWTLALCIVYHYLNQVRREGKTLVRVREVGYMNSRNLIFIGSWGGKKQRSCRHKVSWTLHGWIKSLKITKSWVHQKAFILYLWRPKFVSAETIQTLIFLCVTLVLLLGQGRWRQKNAQKL